MKLILTHDVVKVGRKFDLVEVADGYAQNFLIPTGKAMAATIEAKTRVEKMKKEEASRRVLSDALLAKELKAVSGVSLSFVRRANEKGHLFAAIHQVDIAAELKKQTHLEIGADHILLEKPIKEVGSYTVQISVADKKADVAVEVTAGEN